MKSIIRVALPILLVAGLVWGLVADKYDVQVFFLIWGLLFGLAAVILTFLWRTAST